MPVSYNSEDITAIRRPDGTYVEAVEPLGVPGVASGATWCSGCCEANHR
jgi:hypothetical protein